MDEVVSIIAFILFVIISLPVAVCSLLALIAVIRDAIGGEERRNHRR